MELQLHGREAHTPDDLQAEAWSASGVLPRAAPTKPFPELCRWVLRCLCRCRRGRGKGWRRGVSECTFVARQTFFAATSMTLLLCFVWSGMETVEPVTIADQEDVFQ